VELLRHRDNQELETRSTSMTHAAFISPAQEDVKPPVYTDSILSQIRGGPKVRDVKASTAVRTWREERGLSQEQLSEASEVPRGTIARIEQGKGSPRFDTLTRLAVGLRLASAAELLAGPPARERPSARVAEEEPLPYEVHVLPIPLFGTPPPQFDWMPGAEGFEGDYFVLRHLVRRDGYVVLRIVGDLMWRNYLNGDLVLVDTWQRRPRSKQVVVAGYGDHVGVYRFVREGGRSFLHPDNPEYRNIEIVKPALLRIGGVVVRLVDRDATRSVQ
jgi:phage repressor protein C with HTH and peptisase S24 domain